MSISFIKINILFLFCFYYNAVLAQEVFFLEDTKVVAEDSSQKTQEEKSKIIYSDDDRKRFAKKVQKRMNSLTREEFFSDCIMQNCVYEPKYRSADYLYNKVIFSLSTGPNRGILIGDHLDEGDTKLFLHDNMVNFYTNSEECDNPFSDVVENNASCLDAIEATLLINDQKEEFKKTKKYKIALVFYLMEQSKQQKFGFKISELWRGSTPSGTSSLVNSNESYGGVNVNAGNRSTNLFALELALGSLGNYSRSYLRAETTYLSGERVFDAQFGVKNLLLVGSDGGFGSSEPYKELSGIVFSAEFTELEQENMVLLKGFKVVNYLENPIRDESGLVVSLSEITNINNFSNKPRQVVLGVPTEIYSIEKEVTSKGKVTSIGEVSRSQTTERVRIAGALIVTEEPIVDPTNKDDELDIYHSPRDYDLRSFFKSSRVKFSPGVISPNFDIGHFLFKTNRDLEVPKEMRNLKFNLSIDSESFNLAGNSKKIVTINSLMTNGLNFGLELKKKHKLKSINPIEFKVVLELSREYIQSEEDWPLDGLPTKAVYNVIHSLGDGKASFQTTEQPVLYRGEFMRSNKKKKR